MAGYARVVAHAPAHEEHLSPWPLALSIGLIALYFGVIFRGPVLGLGILLFMSALYGWIYEDYRRWRSEPAHGAAHEAPAATRLKRMAAQPTAWWGVMIFLLTETMLFGALFATYFSARATHSPWPPADALELPVLATGINTAILVSSGGTVHIAYWALTHKYRRLYLIFLGLTIVLGSTFLALQVKEYLELFHEGFDLTKGIYASTFYSLTGIHGAHVTAGLAGLIAVLGRSLVGQFDEKRRMGVEGVVIYWHFVDFVWIFLFSVIYLRVI